MVRVLPLADNLPTSETQLRAEIALVLFIAVWDVGLKKSEELDLVSKLFRLFQNKSQGGRIGCRFRR